METFLSWPPPVVRSFLVEQVIINEIEQGSTCVNLHCDGGKMIVVSVEVTWEQTGVGNGKW